MFSIRAPSGSTNGTTLGVSYDAFVDDVEVGSLSATPLLGLRSDHGCLSALYCLGPVYPMRKALVWSRILRLLEPGHASNVHNERGPGRSCLSCSVPDLCPSDALHNLPGSEQYTRAQVGPGSGA